MLEDIRFEYRRLEPLGRARARLAQLRAERESAGERASELQRAVSAAQRELLAAETAAALGEAKPATVVAARAAFERARAALAAHQPGGGALKAEIRALAGRVSELEREEFEANRGPYLAARKQLVAAMVEHLEAAAQVNARLRELDLRAGRLARGMPPFWPELTAVSGPGYTSTCQLAEWTKQARAAGTLD